jgi:glycosyltransferase involved in cell wall biosynthesis
MNRPIRVLELRSVRGTGGGPEKTIILGTAMTEPSQFAVTVCYLRDQRDSVFRIDEQARTAGIDYVEILERHSFDPAVLGAVRRLVRDRRIDIVHAHDYKTDLLAWLVAKSLDVVPLATVHGWTGHSGRERYLYYPVDKWILARFPRLIAVSSEIRDDLLRWGAAPERVAVVLNGIDHRRFHRDPALRTPARHELGLHDGEIVIGSVGRLEPQKRFDLLIRAVGNMRSARPNIRLLIAGDGSLSSDLRQQIRDQGLESVCRLIGHCGDVPRFHHALDLFVQSSDYEGTPNSVLEAMALETPIVATAAGGTGELVRDGVDGMIVPCGDPEVLANAIDQALTDPVAACRRAIAARERVERELSFERRMRRVETIYRDLMAVRPGKSRKAASSHAIP